MMIMEKKKRGRPCGRKKTKSVQARIAPELYRALAVQADENHRTKNAEMIIALELYLGNPPR